MIRRGLFVQLQVVFALMLRETRTRFGAYRLGFLWALLEPLVMIATFVGFFTLMQRQAPTGMTMVGFLATGLIPYTVFTSVSGRTSVAIESNRGMLFYPQVRPLDLVFARILLEAATYPLIFTIIVGVEALYYGRLQVDSVLKVATGFLLAAGLGGTLGLVLASAAVFSKVIERIQQPLLRPLFWISGIFFCANDLPSNMRRFMLHNPLLHVNELVRDGWFPGYTSRDVDVPYVLGWILVLGFIGLTLERVARRRIQLS